MLILTATRKTQGQHPGDFFDAVEGELAVVFTDCHVDAHSDRMRMRCREGCPARFCGLNSGQMATTAEVSATEISYADYVLALTAYAEHRGARTPGSFAALLAENMLADAAGKLPGTVVGLIDGRMQTRATVRPTVRGVTVAAAHLAMVSVYRHRSGKRLRELDRQERQAASPGQAGAAITEE